MPLSKPSSERAMRERERGGGERAGPGEAHAQGFTQELELLGSDVNS